MQKYQENEQAYQGERQMQQEKLQMYREGQQMQQEKLQTYREEVRMNTEAVWTLMKQDKSWAELSGKTILISGATGMLGKCLIDILMQYNDGCRPAMAGSSASGTFVPEVSVSGAFAAKKKPVNIIALSRNKESAKKRLAEHWDKEEFRYISCDVNQPIPECGQADYIIHAASNTHPLQYSQDSIGTITANVLGAKNLLDYAVSHQAGRFCFVSSVEIYGENRGDKEKFDEDYLGYIDCNTLRAGYPESKRLGETLCNAYGKTYQMDFVIPRLSRVYGPTMLPTDSKAISQFIRKAAAGEDIVLKSDGMQLYSYTYALDAAMGILTVLLKGKAGEAYNISDTGSEVTLRQIAEWLAKDNGVDVCFEIPDAAERAGYSTATKAVLDVGKITALGWQPKTHMREGLWKTVQSLREYGRLQ